ncbi:MAG: hypothetical protein WBA74_18250, partial [Cyclobacteriaceae bacterium]
IDVGAGLHELVPTNYSDKVAKSGDVNLRALQSGARTSTALTAFNRPAQPNDARPTDSREVGLHTGFASSPSKRKGQAGAHDRLREVFDAIRKASSVDEAVNILLIRHLDTLALGEDIIHSVYLTGMNPHLAGIGEMEPVSPTPGPNRLKLAKLMHEIREGLKLRTRSLKRTSQEDGLRSPSPPRESPTSSDPTTGYSSTDRMQFPLTSVPSFGGSYGTFEHTANTAGWATQPHRLGFGSSASGYTYKQAATTSTPANPVAHVANWKEAANRSWNAGDIVMIADAGKGHKNVEIRWVKNHHGGMEIDRSEFQLYLRGG